MRIQLAAVQFAHRQVTVYFSSGWRDLASNKTEETKKQKNKRIKCIQFWTGNKLLRWVRIR